MELEKTIQHIFTYRFPSDEQLVEFANARHGFGDDDGGYGVTVTYPGDLDAYDRDIYQQEIPEGSVAIYCSAYTDEDILVSEQLYLCTLKSYLESNNSNHLVLKLKNV